MQLYTTDTRKKIQNIFVMINYLIAVYDEMLLIKQKKSIYVYKHIYFTYERSNWK